jgi:hypothetical protein
MPPNLATEPTGVHAWMSIQARFDLETAEDLLAPQIRKIAPYEAA